MDPTAPVDADARRRPVGPAARAPTVELGHTVDLHRPRCPACPTWSSPPTAPPSSTARVLRRPVPPPAARRRGRRATPAGSAAPASRSYEPEARQRGRGRPPRVAGRRVILAGTGFRTDPPRTPRPQELFGRPVSSLQLVDPRYYHLDTALAVLDDQTIAYLPEAFSPGSPGGAARAVPRRGHRHRGRRRRPRPQRRLRRPPRRPARRAPPGSPRRCASTGSSARRRSTCPSCSRPAADRSAARWRCAHDHHADDLSADTAQLADWPSAGPRTTTTRCRSSSPPREGAWVTDVDGRRYLDCLAGYSALNFGHRHPALIAAAHAPARPGDADQPRLRARPVRPVLPRARRAVGKDLVLPMNTGAEAVETGDQGGPQVGLRGQGRPRRPGADRRGRRQLPRPHHHDRQLLHRPRRARRLRPVHARLHGRAVRRPGRAGRRDRRPPPSPCCSSRSRARPGVLVPPPGYLAGVRRICARRARAASCRRRGPVRPRPHRRHLRLRRTPASTPDMYLLGKALGGGIVPVSAVVADADVLGVLRPGQHGSHVRRQPAGVRGRPRGRRTCWPIRRAPGPRPRAGRAAARAARGAGRPRRRRGPRPRACGPGIDVDPRLGTRPGGLRGAARHAASSRRTPTARRCGCPRRWWRRPRRSGSRSTPWRMSWRSAPRRSKAEICR